MKKIVVLLLITATSAAFAQSFETDVSRWDPFYSSSNLTNHLISFECSPGDPTTNCPCGTNDVHLEIFPDHAEVTSNYRRTNFFVNAIAAQRFWNWPDGSPLDLGIFKYKADIRLPIIPSTSPVQTQNAQTVQMMLQMWDGTNRIWEANKRAIEATAYWGLNAWETNFGRVYVWTDTTGALELVDTGLTLPVDTNWHTIEFAADMANRQWIWLRADSNIVDLSHIEVPLLLRTNWSTEVIYHITQESCATYPNPGYSNIFYWTTEFRNVEFSRLNFDLMFSDNPITNNFINLEWSTEPYLKYQVWTSGACTAWSNISGTYTGNGATQNFSTPVIDDKMFYRIQVVQ